MHATELIAKKTPLDDKPVLALFGTERFLKLEILKSLPGLGTDADSDSDGVELTRVRGKDADLRSVCDELQTMSMFGDRRIVMIDDADDFVKSHRAGLEKYVANPASGSLLILDVTTWQKSTKLYKAIQKVGINAECSELKGAALSKWLVEQATSVHEKSMDKQTAALMIELTGNSLGLLQQELDKVAALVGDSREITLDDVTKVVGGWRVETTWVMLDAIRDGDVGAALNNLNKLILAGEAPLRILGGMVFTFRKYADAAELARISRDLPGSLRKAGVFPQAVPAAEKYLKRLGFAKASQILQMLVEADSGLKGRSRVDPRLQLEKLFVQLAG